MKTKIKDIKKKIISFLKKQISDWIVLSIITGIIIVTSIIISVILFKEYCIFDIIFIATPLILGILLAYFLSGNFPAVVNRIRTLYNNLDKNFKDRKIHELDKKIEYTDEWLTYKSDYKDKRVMIKNTLLKGLIAAMTEVILPILNFSYLSGSHKIGCGNFEVLNFVKYNDIIVTVELLSFLVVFIVFTVIKAIHLNKMIKLTEKSQETASE